ncbi:MAG: hypothetical protein AB7S38_33665 [Vulcanimicrobiota bacterium]
MLNVRLEELKAKLEALREDEKIEAAQGRLRRAGRKTSRFLSDNAAPLALIVAGAGWLLSKQRTSNGAEVPVPQELEKPEFPMTGLDPAVPSPEEARSQDHTDEPSELSQSVSQHLIESARKRPLFAGAALVAAGLGIGIAHEAASRHKAQALGEVPVEELITP